MRAHGPRRRAAGWAAAAVVLALAAGCQGPLSSGERVEMLMNRNARLERELQETQERLAQRSGPQAAVAETPKAAPEDPFRAVAIRFGKYTGGLAADGHAGRERLKVILEPLDGEGDVVKRAGRLDLEALDLGGAEPKRFAQWSWPAEEFTKTWLSGLGLYGYVLKLDWPGGRPPTGERVLLRARFTTLEGEVLEAETEAPLGPAG